MMMVQELVYDEEGRPVCPVGVDQQRERPEPPIRGVVLVVERGQQEHEDDLRHAQYDLGHGRAESGHSLEPGGAVHGDQVLLVSVKVCHGYVPGTWNTKM